MISGLPPASDGYLDHPESVLFKLRVVEIMISLDESASILLKETRQPKEHLHQNLFL